MRGIFVILLGCCISIVHLSPMLNNNNNPPAKALFDSIPGLDSIMNEDFNDDKKVKNPPAGSLFDPKVEDVSEDDVPDPEISEDQNIPSSSSSGNTFEPLLDGYYDKRFIGDKDELNENERENSPNLRKLFIYLVK